MGEEKIQIRCTWAITAPFLSSPMNMGEVGWGLALEVRHHFFGEDLMEMSHPTSPMFMGKERNGARLAQVRPDLNPLLRHGHGGGRVGAGASASPTRLDEARSLRLPLIHLDGGALGSARRVAVEGQGDGCWARGLRRLARPEIIDEER